jgi:hypothetical protein
MLPFSEPHPYTHTYPPTPQLPLSWTKSTPQLEPKIASKDTKHMCRWAGAKV